jgi:hypothetical protein
MVAYPEEYWARYEEDVADIREYLDVVSALATTWPDRAFVWRGVADASWPLHSSLYRRASASEGRSIRERRAFAGGRSMRNYEADIFDEARRWGLQRTATDRLSALELLAALQHQGVPTRLLDFTHNAVVALWFAVEQQFDDAGAPMPDIDGRVFIAQSNARAVAEEWARSPDLFWQLEEPADWSQDIYVWTPPPIDPRMTRQQGCFVFAGVPSTAGGWWGTNRAMHAHEIRDSVSVPIRMNSPTYIRNAVARGTPPGYPLAFTLRIPADAKARLLRDLESGFGYTHSMLYPDYPGFAAFGRSIPRNPL